jgi:hypothetical protein
VAILSPLTWIGNAAAVLTGPHGAVSRQTHEAGCSRQAAYDHAHQVLHAVADAQLPGPDRQQLLADNLALRSELDGLRRQRDDRLDFSPDGRRRFAATAAALGLSLSQTRELLVVLLGPAAPSRATVGRWVAAAAAAAGRVLAALDAASRPLAVQLCLDEIFFHGAPVLVAVEPGSLAVLHCRREADRTGPTWEKTLRPFTALEAVCRDAGSGLSAGLALLDEGRRQQGRTPLEDGLDVFHTTQEAQRLLGRLWRGVEKHWAAAEEADGRVGRAKEQGRDARGPAAVARAAWRKAFDTFAWYERWEGLWRRAQAALRLFRPDGRLNDRAWAEAELAAVCVGLRAGYWRKLRGYLQDRRTLTFLDRLQRRLAATEPRAELRAELVELWRLEHDPAGRSEALATARAGVQVAVSAKGAADWEAAYARVGAVLGAVVRASSAVECVNSVLRMQQGRHRTLTQPLLDLKRLYWNSRAFRSGKRRRRCPYEHLGLVLPSYDFWELLHTDPANLTQELSTPKLAA